MVEVPTPTLPPKELLEDCKDVDHHIETNKDLAQAFNTRGDMLRLCSADKEALRAWADELQEDE